MRNFFIYRVLHVDDTPHRIALGVAIGMFVTWTPTVGLQMVLTVVLAAILRANKLVGVPFVWLSNPLTLMPVYGPNFVLGSWMLRFLGGEHYRFRDFLKAVNNTLQHHGGWLDWWDTMSRFLLPLWIGSVAVGLAVAAVSYLLTYQAVVVYRRHRAGRHSRRLERQQSRQTAGPSSPSDAGRCDCPR